MRLSHLTLPALVLLAVSCGHSKNKPTDAAATVGKEVITYADLDKEIGAQLQQMEDQYQQQVYQLKKQTLEKLINEKLFAAKAKEAGLPSGKDYLEKQWHAIVDKMPEPSEADVQYQYDQAKKQGGQLPPIDQVRPNIVQYIKAQKAQPEITKFYAAARKEGNVKVNLVPPMPAKKNVEAKGPSMAQAADGSRKTPTGDEPITIVEFSDFQCPYCVKSEPTVKELLAAYPGKIKLVYRDFPLEFHQFAPKAAQASHCAEDQGKYWEMHEKLFALQGQLPVEALKKTAREIQGIDGDKFDKCLDSGEKAKIVEDNKKAGEEAGVNGTPAFFINGRMISGAQPLDSFKTIIDQELAKK